MFSALLNKSFIQSLLSRCIGAVQLAAMALATTAAMAAQPKLACSGPAWDFQPLAPGLWWLPAAPGDADRHNQGHVSNIVIAIDTGRIWLLGSGPTPALGRRLACQVQQRWGRPVSDVISPWPHPELVLGVAGLGPVRHWAHREVAAAMQARCPHCVNRLLEQLGPAHAGDLNRSTVRVPRHLLQGRLGRLGPWRWWLLSRGPGSPVTVWQWRGQAVVVAQGLLWSGGAPDARDADLPTLVRSTQQLQQLQQLPHAQQAATLWLGEQGPPAVGLPQAHQRYWQQLMQDLQAAQARGDLETAPAAAPYGLPADDARHALNWQRAWRQLEGASFQRSLR